MYFCALWMVITVALMNLVTAVIVDSALSLGREEADDRMQINRRILRRNIPHLEELFDNIDKDGSGSVTFQEVLDLHNEGQLVFPDEISAMIDPNLLIEMFEFVDKDQSGEVDKEEFIEGVCCLALASMSIEAMQMLHLIRSCHHMLLDLHGQGHPRFSLAALSRAHSSRGSHRSSRGSYQC